MYVWMWVCVTVCRSYVSVCVYVSMSEYTCVLWMCVTVCVCGIFVCGACMWVYGWVCLCTHAEAAVVCQVSTLSALLLGTGPLSNWKLTVSTVLAGQQASRIRVSPPPNVIRHALPCSNFGMLGIWTQSLILCRPSTLTHWMIPLAPHVTVLNVTTLL